MTAQTDGRLFIGGQPCGCRGAAARAARGAAVALAVGYLLVGPAGASSEPDVPVNGPHDDDKVQNETSIAVADTGGTICSAYNDFTHAECSSGCVGISSSDDGGGSFDDRGEVSGALGAPSLVWSESAGKFLLAALDGDGVGVWSSADCTGTFSEEGSADSSPTDQRPFLAVDNRAGSTFYGRLYAVWTDVDGGTAIRSSYSTDHGKTWSAAQTLSGAGADVQAPWPAVGPEGRLYVAWVRWRPFPNGNIDVEIVRSTDGGGSFSPVAGPMTDEVNPRDPFATECRCGGPALPGNIRYVPAPQLVVGPQNDAGPENDVLHVVYSYDPDGFASGDVVNVYYRRSTNGGGSWEPEVQLNPEVDPMVEPYRAQYFPTLSVGADDSPHPPPGAPAHDIVAAAWYESKCDRTMGECSPVPGDCLEEPVWRQAYHRRVSFDGGMTWAPSRPVSDEESPILFDPDLPACYHGRYDQQIHSGTDNDAPVLLQWADDRNGDADVWLEPLSVGFELTADLATQDVCVGTNAEYEITVASHRGFDGSVLLDAEPDPSIPISFSPPNPGPPRTSTMTVDTAASGFYEIIVTGSSGAVHGTEVTLRVLAGPPAVGPTLLSPGDGQQCVVRTPTLEWQQVADATGYQAQVQILGGDWGSPVFDSAEVSCDAQGGCSVKVEPPLDPGTMYEWRVGAANACPPLPPDECPMLDGHVCSSELSFTTQSGAPSILLVDDDDNAPDVRAEYEGTLCEMALSWDLWDTGNSDGEPRAADLARYRSVVWFTGDEFGGFAGPGEAGETALASWLDGRHGCLLLSSQDYHFDRGLRPFMQNYLGVASVTNDTEQTVVSGDGPVFGGLGPFTLDYPFANLSDTVTPDATAALAFLGDQGPAAVSKSTAAYRTVFLGFPLEAVSEPADRQAVLQAFLGFCAELDVVFADGFESGDACEWSDRVPFPDPFCIP